MKRPAFQFYPGDWRKDPALSACSLAARGLWIELMCVAHESDDYGHLSINGKPMTTAQLSRMVGETPSSVSKMIAELEDAGVFSRENGAIYSRRMVKDEHIRNVRAKAGSLGGNPDLLKQPDNQKVIHIFKQGGEQKPTPSSSSSSSSSEDTNTDAGASVAGSLPACPHRRLIESFGKHLPQLPQPKIELWNGKPADDMRARWKWVLTAKRNGGQRYAETAGDALDWFDRYFGHVAGSDFLSGRNEKWTNCDLGWLMKSGNFAKVVQGNYDNRDAA